MADLSLLVQKYGKKVAHKLLSRDQNEVKFAIGSPTREQLDARCRFFPANSGGLTTHKATNIRPGKGYEKSPFDYLTGGKGKEVDGVLYSCSDDDSLFGNLNYTNR